MANSVYVYQDPNSDQVIVSDSTHLPLGIKQYSGGTQNLLEIRDSSGGTQIVIDKDFKLGIGTSSPSEKLHVYGTIYSQSGGMMSIMGSAGTPGYRFMGLGVNMGMYAQTQDVLCFSTASTERMKIDASGNVYFGSGADSYYSEPDARFYIGDCFIAESGYFYGRSLKLSGSTASEQNALFMNTLVNLADSYDHAHFGQLPQFAPPATYTYTNAYGHYIQPVSNSGAGAITNAYGLRVDTPTGGTNKYCAYFEGKTGINVAAPTRMLSLGGTLYISDYDATWTSDGGWHKSIELPASIIQWLKGAGTISRGIGFSSDVLYFARSGDDGTGDSVTYDMVMDSGGKIGIGTTTPAYKLQIEDTTSPGSSPTTGIYLLRLANNIGWGSPAILFTGYSLHNTASIEVLDSGSDTGNISFKTATNGGNLTEKVKFLNNGNVGIGTPYPTISDGIGLHINGKIIRLGSSKTPGSASAAGYQGEICCDSSYIYVCTATNTWKRAAISTWP